MKPKKATPGKGGYVRTQQFSNTKVRAGLKHWYAWCAGEPEWYECHEHTDKQPGTKICLQWATDGELECPRCRPFVTTSTIAYVPLYREEDHKECLVICHETVADLLAGLEYGVPVIVGRVSADASIFVKRTESTAKFTSALPERQRACDLTPTLLNLWGYESYGRWLMNIGKYTNRAPLDPTAPTPTTANGKPVKPEYAAAMKRWAARGEVAPMGGAVDDAVAAMQEFAKQAEKNGKHTKRE